MNLNGLLNLCTDLFKASLPSNSDVMLIIVTAEPHLHAHTEHTHTLVHGIAPLVTVMDRNATIQPGSRQIYHTVSLHRDSALSFCLL